MSSNVCVMCGGVGYSRSLEHGNEWLCFAHYKKFLDMKTEYKSAEEKAFKQLTEEAKKSAK